MRLPQLPADKANHALTGAVIFVVVGFAATLAGAPFARQIAAAATVGAGVLKEAADWLANRRAAAKGLPPVHGVELADALATSAGGLLCWLAAVATA